MEPYVSAVERLSISYPSGIIVRRWGATMVDFLLLFLSIGLAGAAIVGDETGPGISIIFIVIVAGYYLLLEGLTGRTIGKLLLDLQVVDQHGRLPSFDRMLIRTALRLVEVNPLLAGGLPAGIAAGFSKKKQRLGDMLAETFVIRASDVAGLGEPSEEVTGVFD